MSALEYTTSINTLANIIVQELSNDEVVLLSALFTQLGDTLTTILAYNSAMNGN